MIQLTQKLQSIDRLSQGTSLQVIQKENEWKDKVIQLEKDFKAREEALRKEVDQAQTDKQLISKSYESQLKMMSEHIVELQTQASKPGKWWWIKRKEDHIFIIKSNYVW